LGSCSDVIRIPLGDAFGRQGSCVDPARDGGALPSRALADEATLAAAQRWLADESPAYPHFALAYRDGVVAGLASVAIAHPGIDLQRLLFLKDLFVRAGFRSAGVGLGLLRFLAGHCIAHGIGRIDLTTEDWNEGALRFYDRLGAERHGQKIFLRLTPDTLAGLAG
jgi:GNAT superfamily N-acetyltransferase